MTAGVLIQSADNKGPVQIDELTKGLTSISVSQCQLHIGLEFTTDTFDAGVASSGTVEMLIRVAATADMYMDCFISAGLDALLELFEGPTVTADGTAQSIINRKRSSVNTPDTLVFKSPTTTADGLRISRLFIPGGSAGNSAGNAIATPISSILTVGDYLLRVTNRGSSATDIGAVTSFYEGLTV